MDCCPWKTIQDQSKELEALREQIQLLEAGSSQHLVALQEEQSQLSQKNREDLEGLQNRVDELLAGLQKVQKQAEESAAEAQAANENQVQNLEKSLLVSSDGGGMVVSEKRGQCMTHIVVRFLKERVIFR